MKKRIKAFVNSFHKGSRYNSEKSDRMGVEENIAQACVALGFAADFMSNKEAAERNIAFADLMLSKAEKKMEAASLEDSYLESLIKEAGEIVNELKRG